ncbi:hypothetical protein [Paraburkholderia humisilvae]|uniref:Ig-like domain-containing protein n=1 Tax=Paraburkholderia humisilvae TaxID=627669 RepID=A0A6J5DKZ0_9BURK|nr:hypothetical protein [Paraburkholderia humisilvae]CAB3754748.1 hypothetical protein LMG29542_02443 [Paraburkholderia humisilvae]
MKNIVTCASLLFPLLFSNIVKADDSICAAPLRAALMTVRSSDANTSSSAAATAWQCSFKFSNHDEAIKSGLQVGVVVYGVPLKVGGTFDKNAVDSWREKNCSKSSQDTSFETASYSYLREVAPGAMKAFSDCIIAKNDTGAIACDLTRDPGRLTIKWRRTDGELPSAAPKVQRVMVTNGTCSPGIAPGTAVSEGGTGTPCVADAKKDLMVLVDTDRGLCPVVAK